MPRVALVASLLTLCGLASTAFAGVEVAEGTLCFDQAALAGRLLDILAEHRPEGTQEPTIRVTAEEAEGEVTALALTIRMPDGREALERHYRLSPKDCQSAEELLAVVVARFLEDLPAESWPAAIAEPVPQPPKPAEPTLTKSPAIEQPLIGSVELIATLGSVAAMLPLQSPAGRTARPILEGEIAFGAEALTRRHGFSLLAVLRSGTPSTLGDGHFDTTAAMAQIGWKLRGPVRVGGFVRIGAERLAGSGFDENFSRWLPWLEFGSSIGYRWSAWELGAQIMASPLSHRVQTQDQQRSVVAQRLRAGFALEYHFGSQKL